MTRLFLALAIGALLLPSVPVHAGPGHDHGDGHGHGEHDEAAAMKKMMEAMTPGESHQSLGTLAGSWNARIHMWQDPAGEPQVSEGTSHKKMIMGGRYLHEEFEGDMMGMPVQGMGITGYSNVAGEFETMWIDNMSTHFSLGTGTMKGNQLMGEMKMVDPMTWGEMSAATVTTMDSEDQHTFTMYMMVGGQKFKSMEIVYTRAGS